LISSEEITNSQKLRNIFKMPRIEQITSMMPVFVTAEDSSRNSPAILQRP
jgi:hypothetical protein